MINFNSHTFVERSYLMLLGRNVSSRSYPLKQYRFARIVSLGFFITFILTAVLHSQTAENLDQATRTKNEISKYDQREHPGNDQLLSTRRGLHSILNNPASSFGEQLDRTKGNLLYLYNCFPSLHMGMKIREGVFNLNPII